MQLILCCATLVAPVAGARADAASSSLKIADPWMRSILPSLPAAGYFTLSNESAAPRRLVGASSPACGMLMLHRSINRNGEESMAMVKSVGIPAHGSAAFAPGGYHLMCMSPTKELAPGHSVPVILLLDGGATLTASFPVRGATGK
jgi:periplasmic copper chaperone A